MSIQVKLNPGASLKRATAGASGYDLVSMVKATIRPGDQHMIPTGVHLAMLPGMEAQVRGRSGLASKGIWTAHGTIDSDYRGEVRVILRNFGTESYHVKSGERVAQLVFTTVVHPVIEEVEKLIGTDRGAGGFGSTGR